MTPDRIIILNDRSAALGGATNLALLSAKLFHAAGIPVTYVSGDTGEAASLPDGVELVCLGGAALLDQPKGRRIIDGLYNREASALVRRVIDRLDTPGTVYHLHGWAQTLSPSVFRALRPVEDRLVIHAHDFSMVCPTINYFNFQTNTVCTLKPMGGACMVTHCDKRRRADKAFRTARALVKQRVFDHGATRALFSVIHPDMAPWLIRGGVDPQRIRTARNPVTPFSATRIEAERNDALYFIGRVTIEKGVDLAADAARVAGRRLHVIGDGEARDRLARDYPDIAWEGWRSHGEIADLIQTARALIMPSKLPEPFGLVALEALQSGVPLVAFSDAFVAAEAARHDAAFLADRTRERGLADAVRALDDDAAVKRASEAGVGPCLALSTTPESWRDELLDLYAELLGEQRAQLAAPKPTLAPVADT